MNETIHLDGLRKRLRVMDGLKKDTVRAYCVKVRDFLRWLNERPNTAVVEKAKEVTRQDIENYLEHCFHEGNKNLTRYLKLLALRKYFGYLKYEQLIEVDITEEIPNPKILKTPQQLFTKEEILKLFACLDPRTEKGLRDCVVLILGAFCGLRIGEISRLDIGDMTNDERLLRINVGNKNFSPKKESYRTVNLWKAPSEYVQKWLVIRLNQGAEINNPLLVSVRRGGHPTNERLTPGGLDKLIKKTAQAANIKKFSVTMHMLRTSFASNLRHIRGHDVFLIASLMGHRFISSTDAYIPDRSRISREYPSLAAYWREFNHLWEDKQS